MAGLDLASGIRAYQQGVEWKKRQEDAAVARSVRDEQIARQREMRAKLEEANKEFGRVIDESKAQWGLNGAQGQYTPNEETMFRAAEARGAALARHGMWDEFMANEAKVAPMRQQARLKAVQRFEVDGDAETLARAIYPTLFDGKRLKSVVRDDGNGTGPAALMMEMDDGTKHAMPVDKLYQAAKMATDPKALKREALLNFERARADIYVGREGRVARVRGDESIRVDDAKTKNQAGLRAADNASREKIAAGRDDAMREVAAGRPRAGSSRGGDRGEDGMTPSERLRKYQQEEVGARNAVSNLRSQLDSARRALRDANAKDRPGIEEEIVALRQELNEAEEDHKAIRRKMSDSGSESSATVRGLSIKPDASPATTPPTREQTLGLAAADARDQGAPVQFDLGGRKGTVSRSGVVDYGGLGSATPTKPTAKPDKPAADPKPGKGPDMAAAERIKADFKAGKLTRDQAAKKLRELGFK